jgi:hypothetical protein
MQNIVIDKPYKFVPPHHGAFWPNLLRSYLPRYLRKDHGVESVEFFGTERLKSSIEAGHGVMLAPNHCRPCDPMIVGAMSATIAQPVYIMASWHLFMQGKILAWILPRLGAFSVHREGMDREALKCAVNILVEAKRPLVIFPEGAITRTNDRLTQLMDGTAFIARNAAKQRAGANPAGKVVIHPVAIRYFFGGDVEKCLAPVVTDIEKRLTWRVQPDIPLMDRIYKVGCALLALKETEYFDKPQEGDLAGRLANLIDHLLVPLENEWLKGKREGFITARVKALRTAILPDLVAGDIAEEERARRWRQISDVYLAQQLFFYPADYWSKPAPTPEQLMETVERFEEDITDATRVHRPIHAAVEVGEAIEVSPARERGVETDPVMARMRTDIEAMLAGLKNKRPAHYPRGETA